MDAGERGGDVALDQCALDQCALAGGARAIGWFKTALLVVVVVLLLPSTTSAWTH
jgi:hypothetical protein